MDERRIHSIGGIDGVLLSIQTWFCKTVNETDWSRSRQPNIFEQAFFDIAFGIAGQRASCNSCGVEWLIPCMQADWTNCSALQLIVVSREQASALTQSQQFLPIQDLCSLYSRRKSVCGVRTLFTELDRPNQHIIRRCCYSRQNITYTAWIAPLTLLPPIPNFSSGTVNCHRFPASWLKARKWLQHDRRCFIGRRFFVISTMKNITIVF